MMQYLTILSSLISGSDFIKVHAMNVLIIPSWYPQFEGDFGGSFFKEQAELLSKHNPEHHFMVINCSISLLSFFKLRFLKKKPVPNIKVQKKTIHNLTEIFVSQLWAIDIFKPERKTAKYILNILQSNHFQPDIIHAHVAWNGGYIAMELAKLLTCNYLITEHMGPFPWNMPLFIQKNGLLTNKIKKPLENAAKVIAVSNSLANRMASFHLKRPLVIPNLINEVIFSPEVSPHQHKTFNLLSVGSLIPQKGMDTLLKAFAKAQKKITHLHLTIVGGGEEEGALRSLIHALNIDKHVNLVGVVSRAEMVHY